MNDDKYQQWVDASRRRATQRNHHDTQNIPCVRVSNTRYAQDATLEDRLTIEDKQMLRDMGISL
jgi:hypothetical protein